MTAQSQSSTDFYRYVLNQMLQKKLEMFFGPWYTLPKVRVTRDELLRRPHVRVFDSGIRIFTCGVRLA